ncbi:unnamed protein product [Orchesella dallaii]
MCFRDTIIRVEKCRSGSDVGVAMELHIKLWRYCDESSNDADDRSSMDTAFLHKQIIIEGMTLYTDLLKINPFSANSEDSNYRSTDEDLHEKSTPDNLIMIAKIAGRHEIKLSVKKDDSIGGPQVMADCSFGSLIGFLSPVQFHIILELVKEFVNPEPSLVDEQIRRKSYKEKPMDTFDFKRIEEELQEGLKPGFIGFTGLNHQRGWSSPAFADDSDDEFLPLRHNGGCMYQSNSSTNFMNASMMTSMNISMQQSMTESFASSTTKTVQGHPSSIRGMVTSEQATTQTTKISITFASLAVVLLHEDIITLSSAEAALPSSVSEMREVAGNFFRHLGLFGASVKGKKDVHDVRTKLNEACTRNHHRVIVAPFKLEGIVNLVDLVSIFSGYMAIGYCEIIESLRDSKPLTGTPTPECIEVLVFPTSFEQEITQSARIEFKNKSYKGASKTALKFLLSECQTEVDVSICDRINSLINSRLAAYTESHVDQLRLECEPVQQKRSKSLVSIKMACPKFSLNFRFPIPDLRPVDDISRNPYWRRNLRNDSLVLEMKELTFSTVINSLVDELEIETQCHEARIYYKKTQMDPPMLFATALSDDPEIDADSLRTQGLDWPRLAISIYPKKCSTSVGEADFVDDGEALGSFFVTKDKGSSPFSSRRVIHETITVETDQINSSEESVIPGDRIEMIEFIEETSKSTIFKVVLDLRSVEVTFPSKHFFEELYNRVSTDILLWEPSAPSSCTPSSPNRQFQGFKRPQLNAFTMCKSELNYDSESESEEELATPAINSLKPRSGSFKKKTTYGQSEVTMNITVKKAVCSMFTPLQDTTGNIVPGQRGQFAIKIEDGNFFMVSGFKGNPTLGYLCFHSEKGTLYHCDFDRGENHIPSFVPSLLKTIYPSEHGVFSSLSNGSAGEYQDLLSVAVKIERDSTTNVKNFKVALGIKGATLHHRLTLPNRSWFTQLTDFFDVLDTPVMGYTPSSVITELHLHLWECAIDYRPLYLPFRCFLTMENFSISSNIAALTSTSVIRFISEDASLFLGTKIGSTDLKNDYVCVMDMDLFELSLRLCGNRNVPVPRLDLSASNNVLHIRTCSDSFKALTEVLTYFVSDGDLVDPSSQNQSDEDRLPMNPIKECSSEPALINTEEISDRDRRMSVSQTEHLHDLVADAMEDTASPDEPNFMHSIKTVKQFHHKRPTKQSFEIHYTPSSRDDDGSRESCNATPLPDEPIMETTSGLPVDIPISDEDDEEEFCILENDPGVGIVPKTGEPEARMLIDEPIRLVENHFSVPVGRMDILKAPKHYPNPIMKYSVHEMSIVWHLYGGEDFESTVAPKRHRVADDKEFSETVTSDRKKDDTTFHNDHSEVDIAVDALNPGVVFSKTKAFENAWEAYESPKPPRKQHGESSNSWRNKGGLRRKHDTLVELHLNKIKFQHEIYPESTEQASRLVVVINNIEIRDRLVSSPFNKMLYLYTSPTRPRQSHANMIVLKAVHLRPDPQLSSIEECCLKISLLPIRLNIDQDSVLFLYQFFAEQIGRSESDVEEDSATSSNKPPSHTPSVESLPVMTINVHENEMSVPNEEEYQANLLMFGDEHGAFDDSESTCSKDPSIDSSKPATPVYFRQVIFSPDVPIRLDYQGKRVDMTHGPIAGLLMGLAQLNCSEIRLKRINHRYGILGMDKLALFLMNEWAADIKKNQLPSLLGGVGPMYSFVQLFQGVRDLFWLPIEQYQKDGRIAKGIQRGANAFSTSAALAALELTNRFVKIIQGAAEITYDMVSPGPSVQQKRRHSSKKKKRYTQPGDIREGVTNAYNVVKEGLGDTAHTIVQVASIEHEQKGMSGAVGGVLRQIPPTVVRPIILMAEATTNVIDGFRSQLEPEFKKEAEEKWKES